MFHFLNFMILRNGKLQANKFGKEEGETIPK